MSANYVPSYENPYTPPAEAALADVDLASEQAPPQQAGSPALIILGVFLLIGGHLLSNVFMVSDLYHVALGRDGEFIPSPMAATFQTPAQQWIAYGLGTVAILGGCLLIGSQAFHPMATVCFILVPLAGIVFLIGATLRIAHRFAFAVAAVYLTIGVSLAASGGVQLFRLYGEPSPGLAPLLISMMAQAGAAFAAGAILKLVMTPEEPVASAPLSS